LISGWRKARAEVGAADADIDDVADRLAGGAAPVAAVNLADEALHFCEFGAHRRHHVLPAVHQRSLVQGAAQGDVQGGTPLAVVDGLAAAHARDPGRNLGGLPEAM
jgi:hypothetical protein